MIYRRWCYKHHRERKKGRTEPYKQAVGSKKRQRCSLCGWLGVLHMHRMDSTKPYEVANVMMLCPNCHSAQHDTGEPNQLQLYPGKLVPTAMAAPNKRQVVWNNASRGPIAPTE